jgi:hypothetical protein
MFDLFKMYMKNNFKMISRMNSEHIYFKEQAHPQIKNNERSLFFS